MEEKGLLENTGHNVQSMYEQWFLEYASYVILERAVPEVKDGLKPVQRRIMHALKEMDDGRFNKVANVIGQTMQYHPHGDQSIASAMINLGQKDLLIDTQGNWGDYRTGDSAAASRYIEARLSKFALDVAFNPKTTEWKMSYDGRKKEPVNLPMKFPLLLAQGAEGIAVGLATKILPHNFCELIEASIKVLKGRGFVLFPDFPTTCMIDVDNYNNGLKGGKVKIRVPIEEEDKKTLLIKSVPYGVTTTQLIDSILKANDNGKIKIKSVVDNTAKEVEIAVTLASGMSSDQTIDALYAFTDCETSISPNACIIINEKPHFIGVTEILKHSVVFTQHLLLKELNIKLDELRNIWHYSSLEKIFIENRIYRDIEEETTWEGVLAAIDRGLDPFKKSLKREVVEDDLIRLTEIKIKRISKYDSFKADEHISATEEAIKQTEHDIEHIVDYTVAYYEALLKKYGKGKERKSEIRTFEEIKARRVAIANQKLYVNRKEGFVGTSLKKDEFALECSDIDQIIAFRKNGTMTVVRVASKVFIGKDIIHVGIYRKADDRITYNMIYMDGKTGIVYAKRFHPGGVTLEKEYDLTAKNPGSKVLYFSENPNAEAEIVSVKLSPGSKAKKKVFDYPFEKLQIKGRGSKGNQVTKYPVRDVKFKEHGKSTLEAPKVYYDEQVGRLNVDEYGTCLGRFNPEDQIVVFYDDGSYEVTDFDLTNRYDTSQVFYIKKMIPEDIFTAVYWDNDKKQYNVKRFEIETQTLKTKFLFIKEGLKNKLLLVTDHQKPIAEMLIGNKKSEADVQTFALSEIVSVSGWKAIGNRLTDQKIWSFKLLSQYKEPKIEDVPQHVDQPEEGGAPTLF